LQCVQPSIEFHKSNQRNTQGIPLKGMIEAEVHGGVRPIAETKDIAERSATSQSGGRGNGPGGTGCRLNTCLDKAKLDAAVEGSGVQRFVRKSPAEKDGTMLKS
jgi:hypothetical protein